MAEPLISIVIPCYNYGRYVGQAIESVLAQRYPNKQVLIINDGSTDNSLEVIQGHIAANPSIELLDQPNLGSIAAYTRGFAQTRGDVVMFLDADDLYEPGVVERVARAWHPGCSKVQWDLRIIDGDGNDLGRRFCNFSAGYDAVAVRDAFRRTGTYRWPVTAGNAYSRGFIEAALPFEVTHGPDGTLNTLAPLYGDVVTLPEVLGAYRLHGRNRWASDGADRLRLPERIEHRRTEERLLRRHAQARGVRLPESSILDHELTFINYRLLAKKLGLDYEGSADDTVTSLLSSGCRLVLEEARHGQGLPARLMFAHLLWFGVLSGAPKPAARGLYSLRFNRSALLHGLQGQLDQARRAIAARASSLRPGARGHDAAPRA
ncbi:MAG TPA: glycosyltransferase [Polyangiaceae bacterium]|nr:glycosyltransferase [Polyangiaceae bacterium]